MFDSTKQFARQFRPVEGGYLYFPGRWGKGYLVSQAEYEQLCAEWRKATGWRGILILVAIVTLVLLLLFAISTLLDLPPETTDGAGLPLGFGLAAYLLWKAAAPYRLIRHREPVAPRRTSREAEADMARTISWPMAALMAILSAWFVFLFALVTLVAPLIGVPLVLIFGVATYFNGRAMYRKWSDRKA
jgi:hypothetical protein